jgi:hypothetical protein
MYGSDAMDPGINCTSPMSSVLYSNPAELSPAFRERNLMSQYEMTSDQARQQEGDKWSQQSGRLDTGLTLKPKSNVVSQIKIHAKCDATISEAN